MNVAVGGTFVGDGGTVVVVGTSAVAVETRTACVGALGVLVLVGAGLSVTMVELQALGNITPSSEINAIR